MNTVLKFAMVFAVLFLSLNQYAENTQTSSKSSEQKTNVKKPSDKKGDGKTKSAQTARAYAPQTHADYWSEVMNAIIQVESGGNSKAVNGRYAGAMQISPVLVKECNSILESRGNGKRYSLSDRFSIQKSKEMFLLIQSHYNPANNIEKGIRLWNGGCNYTVKATNRYYKKVMRQILSA